MKLGLLADIHEHVDHLRRLLAIMNRQGVDRFVILGDVFEMGTRIDETVQCLKDVAAVGVWGNHDIGLCLEVTETTRQRYSPAVLDFMGSLRPRMEIDGCLLTHVEPWLDPNKIEDLWYVEGSPTTKEQLARSFAAVPHRVIFGGHFHRWLLGNRDGISNWQGESPLNLNPAVQHLVVVHAVWAGHGAIFDTKTNELLPVHVE